jgi:hypothetical protein
LVPAEFTAQQGLFIEPFAVGELKSALGSIQEIPAADYKLSEDNLNIDVTFNDDLSTSIINQVREFSGYSAVFFAPYYDIMTEEQRQKMVEELTKGTAPDAVIKSWKGTPYPDKLAGTFVFDVNFTSTHFLEKAGPRILFKAGELIGPQTEMYRDDQRVTDIENDHNRGYDRVIKIHVPNGYTFKNLDDLNFNVVYKDKEETPFVFLSSYAVKNNLVEVHITEYYNRIFAPIARYEDYRKVINAAADFNKVTLVLEKTK